MMDETSVVRSPSHPLESKNGPTDTCLETRGLLVKIDPNLPKGVMDERYLSMARGPWEQASEARAFRDWKWA